MREARFCQLFILTGILTMICMVSCKNQSADIPLAASDSAYAQPVSKNLQFSEPRKLNWRTVKSAGIKPTIKKLDLDKLPFTYYDTTGFKSFPKPPQVVHFDLNQLPDTSLNLEKIPDQSLKFKTRLLSAPVLVKSGLITPKSGTKIGISEIGLAQGIPDKSVLTLFKDKKGFIWIGTDKALYRYDGEYMSVYHDFPIGVENMIEDSTGRLWFITNAEIGTIDLMKGTISSSNAIHTLFPALPRMIFDQNGKIWISRIAGKGVSVIDPQTLTFKHLDKAQGLAATSSWGIWEDGNKNVWITGPNGVSIINAQRNRIKYLKRANGLGGDTTFAITGDRKGRIWITEGDASLTGIDPGKETITNYENFQGIDNFLAYRAIADDKNQIWIASNRGVSMLSPDKNLFRYFYVEEGVPEDYILDIMKDDQDRIWMSTFSQGIRVMEQDGEIIHPTSTKSLSTLMEDSRGRIWVGAGNSSDGIQILDKENKKAYKLNKSLGIGDNFIQNLSEMKGKIWVSTDGGFDIIDPLHKTVEHYGKKEGLTSDTLYSVIKDNKGNLWFTGPALGLDVIDSASNKLIHAGVNEGLSENNVNDIRMSYDGKIWIATNSKGVDLYDPETGTIRNLRTEPGLKDTSFKILLPQENDKMWIGTDKGIYIADTKRNRLTTITTAEGLCNDRITSLLEYKGSVIAGTVNQVSIITPPDKMENNGDSIGPGSLWKISTLAGSEGLTNSSGNWNTNLITKNDEYYWADADITIINGIHDLKRTSPVFIAGISIMNQKRNFNNAAFAGGNDTLFANDSFYIKDQIPANQNYSQGSILKWDSVTGPYNIPVNLRIPYNENYIQIQYAQQHMGLHEDATYSYILEGLDKSWSANTNKAFTDNYLNLSPGNYTFKVVAKDPRGRWSKPASFSFTILPPWWKTWWMYCVYVLALIGAFYGYNKYRSVALVKENRILEERVQARTKEVKQQADELTTINQISQALVGQADLHDLINLTGNQLRDLFKANIVYIALLDSKTKMISFPYQHGDNMQPLKLGEGLTSKIILTGEPLLINKDVDVHASELGIGRVGIPAASYLGVPIPVSNEIIGVLSIQSTEKVNRFAEKDKNLLTTIAANVGVAIRKARLFEEVKKANADADMARKNAEEANAAKSAFLSTVSHELRTPLTSVLGFTRITRKRLEEKIFPLTDKSDPKTVKIIEQISGNLNVVISEGERLTNLINDVLDLAKIEAGKMEWNMETVRVSDIVERAVTVTSSLFEQKNLKLETKIAEHLPDVLGDRDKLIQVVVNLLSNAVKFTNEGSVICNVYQKDEAIVVGITDTGIGIAPEDHDKVFEQFKQVGDTLTDKPKGTGLGLPICKEIVEHHHGKIWLESELGHGSTFYFMLPVLKSDQKEVKNIQFNDLIQQLKKRVEKSRPSVSNNNAMILVVDDDDGIRSLLKQELGEIGYNIEEAANGKEAILKIRANRPDLIILDVMMPEMNGFDVAAILKNDPQTMEIPIIILSIVQDKSRGFRIGVDRYLTKPIDTGLLFSEIGDLLEQGKSKKKVMVVDEDSVTIRTLTDVLEARGYQVVESDGKEMVEKAIATKPDIIILNSVLSDKQEIVKSIRFEKGLENVLFLIYQ